MIRCSNCQYINSSGTSFCVECGSQLDGIESLTTQAVSQTQDLNLNEIMGALIEEDLKKRVAYPESPDDPTKSWLSLHLMDSGKILLFSSKNEFTLGRLGDGQSVMPDIDLTPYQAYASGVSRLHVLIKRESEHVVIMDLGSRNGTYLNGRHIDPHIEETLSHGDIVTLGKFKIQVLLRTLPDK